MNSSREWGDQLPRSEWPTITEFYSGHDIFITGATGFMGKCLVEKVLRSLPTAGRVFVMMRAKKGKSVKERMEELTNLKVSSESKKITDVSCLFDICLCSYSSIYVLNLQK